MKSIFPRLRDFVSASVMLLVLGRNTLNANPTGGTVSQGSATFSSSGSQFNINQSTANALINWQSFNIGSGESVNFNQPSSTSVAWNQINDPNPSQILGSLNANGYVILQNSSGFIVGGQAAITAHGLIMTTASTPALNLSSGGPWSFNTPPPTAKIVNYGQINIAGGGPAYLIANDIENNGTISAPGGKIGLYAGEKVLVSTSPDGRGLSAQATIPQGLVDNSGNLMADGGSIALQARMVNQNGLIQANSVKNVNGTIELIGSDSVNLGANSVISAQGGAQGTSSGGSVTIKSDNNFSDQEGSAINIAGGAQGGNGGQVEISAPQMSAINSSINGQAANGFISGVLTIDPYNILLSSSGSSAPGSGTVNAGDPPTTVGSTLTLNVNSFASTLSQINLQAQNNIELNTAWILAPRSAPATLSLSAGNNITLDSGSSIQAGNNWTINLTAGTQVTSQSQATSGNDGIYLRNDAYLQTQTGDINLWAANEVQVGWSGQSAGSGNANSGTGAIRTLGGGNIDVTAEYGDVNSGSSYYGFNYNKTAPYYTPSSNLGGISTANGGSVTINAGNDVISFPAATVAYNPTFGAGYTDPGSGAFGSAAGDVTINAGHNVYGHFVVMNGTGKITAGQDIGTGPSPANPNGSERNVALSLAKGSWNLNAQGNIFLQEVRNPNGDFNNTTTGFGSAKRPTAGNHLFDYDPGASLSLTAGNGVYLTGFDLPRPNGGVPLLLPPIVTINAGPGGVVLYTPTALDASGNDITTAMALVANLDFTLFPSPYQSLSITTTGGGWLSSGNADGTVATLLMSDSGLTQWYDTGGGFKPFGEDDHSSIPLLLNNNDPVTINLSGSQTVNGVPVLAGMENIVLQTDKATQVNVAGDMIGCSFFGENLHASDVTSINVGGQIYNAGSFTSVTLNQGLPMLPAADTPLANELSQLSSQGLSLSSWYVVLMLAVNPSLLPAQSLAGESLSQLLNTLSSALPFRGLDLSSLVYDPNTRTLTSIGPLSPDLLNVLESPTLAVVRFNANGYPVLDAKGHFVLDTIDWMPASSVNASLVSSLFTDSQATVPLGAASGAYVVGGTGEFNVTAGSISLGNSEGILSIGTGKERFGRDYSFLTPYISSAANINVTAGYLEMPASTIACLAPGGNVTVTATGEMPGSLLNDNGIGVSMDLGSQELLPFEAQIMNASNLGLGIYSSGNGNVNVTAFGTIDIDSSRIATFGGGNISVESENGDVNAGSGGTAAIPIDYFSPSVSGFPAGIVPANGIVASTLTSGFGHAPGAIYLPGNITVATPHGSINADLGGISQQAFGETLSAADATTTISLFAGTPKDFNGDWYSEANDWSAKPPLYVGNIALGTSGVIGLNVIARATGLITGLIISQRNADIAAQSFAGIAIAGKSVNLQTPNVGPSLIIGPTVNISGGAPDAAKVFSGSVNGGAGTLATSSSASSTGSSAAGQTSNENQQQVASNSGGKDDKKKKKKEELVRTVGRVTVILPRAS